MYTELGTASMVMKMMMGYEEGLVVFFTVILMLSNSCHSDKAPNYSFMRGGVTAPPISYYDYIIIGGGTSGCALAATLSHSSTVLLLERGGSPYGNPNIEDIASFNTNIEDDSPSSPSQRFVSEDGVINARARVLGGGSAINAGFYTRASQSYIETAGWDESKVNKSYEWVERKLAFEPPMLQFQSAFRDGLIEVGVEPYNGFTYEHLYGTKVGGTIFDEDGKRHTAADLLEYADSKRITVFLHSTVQRIIFTPMTTTTTTPYHTIHHHRFRSRSQRQSQSQSQSQIRPRAIGVIFRDVFGGIHRAILRPTTDNNNNEVILTAGALGSPQLLMLSGIGPAAELHMHGIDVIHDLPRVGLGMADNPMNGLFVPSPSPVEVSLIQAVGITKFDSYIEASSGSTFARAFARNLPQRQQQDDNDDDEDDDNQKMRDEKTVADVARAYSFIRSLINGTTNGGMILEKTMGPRSKGYLRLRTRNPDDNPSVTFNYFQHPDDLARCVQGMETVINVIESRSFSGFRMPLQSIQSLMTMMVSLPLNFRPRHLDSALSLEQFCRDTVMTIWHYHGGCRVGEVVDSDYKVYGVDSLRVIDGSTFYDSPGTNPQATVMMLGRYMGKKILDARRGHK